MNRYVKAVVAFLLYGVVQVACGGVMAAVLSLKGEDMTSVSPAMLALCLLASGVLTAILVWRPMQMIRMPAAFSVSGLTSRGVVIGLSAGLLGIVALNIAGELADLPDNVLETLERLAVTPLGALTVGIIGPVCEELVFREGIQGHLQRGGAHPAVAILVASVLFGVLHFNPMQTFFAALMGIILGVLYWRTGSVLLCSALHVVNNSAAVVQMWMLGPAAEDFSLCDVFGSVAAGTTVMVACAIGCIALLLCFWRVSTAQHNKG